MPVPSSECEIRRFGFEAASVVGQWVQTMEFIEMSGGTLLKIVGFDGGEPTRGQLEEVGVNDESLIRVNRQGDIELRRPESWDLIGGLLGDFENRLHDATGLQWA